MDEPRINLEAFVHIRIVIAIIVGLSISRLLLGFASFIQHPGRRKIYPIHFGWALFFLLWIMHFWWFQLALSRFDHWTFGFYFFVIVYAVMFFLACTILFPDSMEEYSGYDHYFQSRRKWFYGLLAAILLIDLADTAFKGAAYFQSLGLEYPIGQAVFFTLSAIAMFVRSRIYQGVFVAFALIYQIAWILRQLAVPS